MNVLFDEYSVPKSIDKEKAEKNCGGLNDRWAQTSEKSFPKEDFTARRPRECNHPSPWPRRSRLDKSRRPPPPHRRRTVPPGSDIKSLPLS
jgi:hypothetical protein